MDFDDKQDTNEKRFDRYKYQLLNGHRFDCPHETIRGEIAQDADIDSLMMKMYLGDVHGFGSVSLLEQASSMISRQAAHVGHQMKMNYNDAEELNVKFAASTVGDWLIKAFRKDSDFVDEAVTHIMDGTAAAFFE